MYTKNFNLYLPETDDSNLEYVPGFKRNFEILDILMAGLTSQSIVDPFAKKDSELKMKKSINDEIVSRYQAHRDSFTNTTNMSRPESGSPYRNLIKENPHAVTPDQLMFRDDITRGQELDVTLPQTNQSGDIIYNPLLNSGHNAIISEINNVNDDIITVRIDGKDILAPRVRNKMILGYGKTKNGTNGRTIIDYSEMYLQDIGNNIDGKTANLRQQERADATKYRNHKYLFVDTDNQVDNDYSRHTIREDSNSQTPYRDDFRRDKHVSDYDMFHFESHLRNLGHGTSTQDKNTYSEMLINGRINANPHKVTATDLYDIDTINASQKITGKNAIIKELNKQVYSSTTYTTKIYWNLIDKENVDGNGNKANIVDIPLRKHNDLQEVKELILNNTYSSGDDDVKDKHISINQGKKWESHVDTNLQNPHKVKAEQLYNKSNVQNAHVAILEQINILEDRTSSYDNNKILWNTIDKNNTDGRGTKANIKDIPIRKHDDLQDIHMVDLTTVDFAKNKHISSMQLNSLYQYIEVKDGSNIHHVTANALLGNDRSVPEKHNVTNITPITNGRQQSIDIPFMPNNRDLYLDIEYNISQLSGVNIDIYFNNYYLGQIGQKLQYTYVIPKVYIANANKIIIYWNNGNITNNVVKGIKYYQPNKEYGRNAIIDEINRDNTVEDNNNNVEYKKILWKCIDTAGSSITDFTKANHYDLQNIDGYEIESNPNDPNQDNKQKRNKHISNIDGVRWDNHVADTTGNNPHNTIIENIKGLHKRSGATAVIDALNKFIIDLNKKPTSEGSDEAVGISNYLRWDLISKKNSNITDLTTRNHNDLQNILQANLTLNDTVGNKHISNSQGKKWEDHVNTVSEIGTGGSLVNNRWKNPHKIIAASLYSHKDYSGNQSFNGGNAIVDAINDFSINKILWDRIDKTNSNILNIQYRKHNDLQEIEHVNAGFVNESMYDLYKLHISQTEYDNWETHRNNKNNPHELKAHQIKSSNVKVNDGANAIIEEINTNSSNKIYWENIDFVGSGENQRKFNIKDIPLRAHNDLTGGTFVVDGKGSPDVMGHVTNRKVLTWDNHLSNTNNPHNTTADQIPIGISDLELEQNGLRSKNLKDAILEIDTFRNRTSSGLVSMPKNDDNPLYYFDSQFNLYVPESVVYLNNQSNYAGKIQLFTTPVGNYQGEKPNEIEFNKFWRISVDNIPKNNKFFVYAKYSNKTVNISVSTTRIQDGQSALLLIGFIRTESSNLTSTIVEGMCYANDMTALGLSEKMLNRMVVQEPIQRHTGLNLKSEIEEASNALYFKLTEGAVWDGLQLRYTDEIRSKENITSNKKIILAYRQPQIGDNRTPIWNYDYNYTSALNTVYQNPNGGLEQATSNKIICNFIYLDVFTSRVYIVLSEKLIDTPSEFDILGSQIFPSVLPEHIKQNCILCGVLLCKQGNNRSFERIYSCFDTTFTNTTISQNIEDHNLLQNINTANYWHLTRNEYNLLDFILHDNVVGQESGFEKKVTSSIVDKRINQILTSNKVPSNLDTIIKIATVLNTVNANKVDKNGDNVNGEYIFTPNSSNSNVIVVNSNNSNSSVFIGDIGVNHKQNGYFISHESKDKRIHLYSQNGFLDQTYNGENNLEILNIDSLGIIEVKTQLNSQKIEARKRIDIDNGLSNVDNISINNESDKFSLSLGNISNQGTLLLKHNIAQCSSVFRARNERLEIDGYGAIFLNTDLSRPLGTTQSSPENPKGLKYKDSSGQGVYDVFIGNVGTTESPIYPIKLSPTKKSYINRGLHIGTNQDDGAASSILSINGTVDLMGNNINRIGHLQFGNGNQIHGDSILTLNLGSSNIVEFTHSNNNILALHMLNAYSVFKYNNRSSIEFNVGVDLYYNSIKKMSTTNNGIDVVGEITSNNIPVVLSNRRINTGTGLVGGNNLQGDITISLSQASSTNIGGVKVDNNTILVDSVGTITAQALKNNKFTMKYDTDIQGIVIEFV